MVQINSVRNTVPTYNTPLAAGALQGLGKHFEYQQAKEMKEQESLMSILPALASIRALEPAKAGDAGAIDMGGGNWVKIIKPAKTSADLLADQRTKNLQSAISPEALAAKDYQEYVDNNAIVFNQMEPEEADAMKKAQYAEFLRVRKGEGPTAPKAEEMFIATDPKTGVRKQVNSEQAAQAKKLGMTVEPLGGPGAGGGDKSKGFFMNEEGNVDVGRVLQTAPAALYGGWKALPLIGAGLRGMAGPVGLGLSGIATGANMYQDRQKRTGGRTLFEDATKYEQRTGKEAGWSLADLFGRKSGLPQAPQAQVQPDVVGGGVNQTPDPATLRAIAQMMGSQQQPQGINWNAQIGQ